MPLAEAVTLPSRGLLRIGGEDARTFLNGLVSNDVRKVAADRVVWAAFLSPQGKYLHDFFVLEHDGALLLDGEGERLADLKKRLSIYRLRSKIVIDDVTPAFQVAALLGDGAAAAAGLDPAAEAGRAGTFGDGVVYVDPRHSGLGLRAVLPREHAADALAAAGFTTGSIEDYERRRIRLGVPDGSRDMLVDRSLLLEGGFDELHGIDWDKGCYLGQELTARSRYRGLIRKRLMPAEVDGTAPAPGTPVLAADKEVGDVRSGIDGLVIALVRLEALEAQETGGAATLQAGGARLRPIKPDWANF